MLDLNREAKVTRVMDAVAAGTTVQTQTTGLDMAGFESCTFIASFGTLTANQVTSVEVHQCDTVAGTYAAIAGSNSGPLDDDDDDKLVVVTVVRPREQFLKVVINRATANAVIDGVVAIQSPAHKAPVSHAASVALSESVFSPAEGTA